MDTYNPRTTIDYDKEYENYSDCYVDGVKQKILWPFKVIKNSIYRNSKGNGRINIMFVNKNMYGFNTIKDISISAINRVRKRNINDDYLPTVYGVGCHGQGFDAEIVVDGVRYQLPEYVKWRSMLARCYSNDKAFTIYRECGHYVCKEWLCYEYFCKTLPNVYGYADWVANGKTGYDLDKDLFQQNEYTKVYSVETCALIPTQLNASISRPPVSLTGYYGVYDLGRINPTYSVVVDNIYAGTFDSADHAACFYNYLSDSKKLQTNRNFVNNFSMYEINQHRKTVIHEDQTKIVMMEDIKKDE